jgi:hypothetical protein
MLKNVTPNHLKNVSFGLMIISWISICSRVLAGPIQTDVPALKDVFANDCKIGCLLSYAHVGFSSDPYVAGQSNIVDADGGYLIKYHMNSMSPGNWMKSTYIVDMNGSATAYNNADSQAEKDSINVHPIVTFNGNIIAQLNWLSARVLHFADTRWSGIANIPARLFPYRIFQHGARLTKEQMTDRLDNYIKEVIRIIHEGWPAC